MRNIDTCADGKERINYGASSFLKQLERKRLTISPMISPLSFLGPSQRQNFFSTKNALGLSSLPSSSVQCCEVQLSFTKVS